MLKLFKQPNDHQKALRIASREIASTIEYDKILKIVNDFLIKTIGVSHAALFYYDKTEYIFNEIKKNGWMLKMNHPLIRLLKKVQTPVFLKDIKSWQKSDEMAKQLSLPNISSDLEIIKRDLNSKNFVAILPLISKQRLVGLLAIGEKHSKSNYNTEERKLLHALADQLAITMENANLYQQIKTSEEMIKQQRDKIQSIITNLTDGLIVTDNNKNIILANPAAEKFFPKRRLVGETLPEILDQEIDDAKTKFPLIADIEISSLPKTTIRVITDPLYDQQNKQTGYIKILHDITRDKEIDKIKSDFIRIAAHKLRTPLSATKWILKMLISGDLGEIPPKQKEFIEKGYQSNERIIRVVNDLLNVSEIEEGKFNFRFEDTQITAIINKIIEEVESLFKGKNQRFSYRSDPKIPIIQTDPYKIELAIKALILNSIQYTNRGGKIDVKLENLGKEIKFTVTDNGVGIPRSQQDKIFTKFMRGDNVIQMETEGNGLGLYIAKNIIEGHKGKIGFQSTQDKGSTFYFTLPIKYKLYEQKKF
jgi:two-component system sensor histidine kinase VicK